MTVEDVRGRSRRNVLLNTEVLAGPSIVGVGGPTVAAGTDGAADLEGGEGIGGAGLGGAGLGGAGLGGAGLGGAG